jgi:hypothetical protein
MKTKSFFDFVFTFFRIILFRSVIPQTVKKTLVRQGAQQSEDASRTNSSRADERGKQRRMRAFVYSLRAVILNKITALFSFNYVH